MYQLNLTHSKRSCMLVKPSTLVKPFAADLDRSINESHVIAETVK